ncbi:MAG: D-alanine--D-alanine ligase [Flavisolibacter sp.]|nr:D-alanine--D-alanine ligase [Flavisolibacter sp.]
MRRIVNHPFFIRLMHWEYWPFHVVYGFLYPYWFWLCLKARSFFFFNTANPTVKNGGFLMESKHEIYDLIPPHFYPKTLFFKNDTPPEEVWQKLSPSNFSFPLIGKPDIGMRGLAVKQLNSIQELNEYISTSKVDFLIQEFVSYPMEAGIFYYRFPGEKKGKISGIVSKEFLTVEGDGVSTIYELLQKDKRSILQLESLTKACNETLHIVLKKGEQKVLVPYGNHARGAKFLDASNRIDAQLETTIDSICQQIDRFYYGRLDIRFNSWEELKEGKNFSIIELNGAGSEPTHIYDPEHSIFFAWKEIIRHFNILYRISKLNHHPQKLPYLNFSAGVQMFRENAQYLKLLNGPQQRA